MPTLHLDAKLGNIEAIKTIQDPLAFFEKDSELSTPLHVAATYRQYKWIKAVIDMGMLTTKLILDKNQEGSTFLHLIISSNEEEIIEHCINECIKEYPDSDWPYLHQENKYGEKAWELKSEIANKILIKLDSSNIDHVANSPLSACIKLMINPYRRKNYFQILEELVNQQLLKPELLLRPSYIEGKPESPLKLAARLEDLETLRLLLPVLQNNPVNTYGSSVLNDDWLHEIVKKPDSTFLLEQISDVMPAQSVNSRDINFDTPLHVSVKYQRPIDTIKKLLELGGDLTLKSGKGDTLLMTPVYYNNFSIISDLADENLLTADLINTQDHLGRTILHILLCYYEIKLAEKLVSLGGSLDIYDYNTPHPYTPITMFYRKIYYHNDPIGRKEIIAYINQQATMDCFKINEMQLKNLFSIYHLYFIFGGEKLINAVGTLPQFKEGGNTEEIIPLLIEMISEYITTQKKEDHISYEPLLNLLKQFTPIDKADDEVIKKILGGEPVLIQAGYETHSFCVLFEKKDDQIVLSLAERGALSQFSESGLSSVTSISFPAEKDLLAQVLQLLYEARISSVESAKYYLFTELPNLVNSSFKMENSQGMQLIGKRYKIGICFWGGPKTAIHDWFIKKFGIQEGSRQYKNFSIFMREKALRDYLSVTSESEVNKDLVQACENIIEQKKVQYDKRFNINNDLNNNYESSTEFSPISQI